jgi:hypothetical protein
MTNVSKVRCTILDIPENVFLQLTQKLADHEKTDLIEVDSPNHKIVVDVTTETPLTTEISFDEFAKILESL